MQENEIIIRKLERDLEMYDTIFLFQDSIPEIQEMLKAFCQSEALKHTEKNVLVMALEGNIHLVNGQYYQLTKAEFETLYKLYCMYEFTDRLRVIDTSGQCGSLVNYVQMGMLTREEMFEALLH